LGRGGRDEGDKKWLDIRYSLKVDSTGFNDEPVCSVKEREVSQLITMLSY
jgi:hypothetical protein